MLQLPVVVQFMPCPHERKLLQYHNIIILLVLVWRQSERGSYRVVHLSLGTPVLD